MLEWVAGCIVVQNFGELSIPTNPNNGGQPASCIPCQRWAVTMGPDHSCCNSRLGEPLPQPCSHITATGSTLWPSSPHHWLPCGVHWRAFPFLTLRYPSGMFPGPGCPLHYPNFMGDKFWLSAVLGLLPWTTAAVLSVAFISNALWVFFIIPTRLSNQGLLGCWYLVLNF